MNEWMNDFPTAKRKFEITGKKISYMKSLDEGWLNTYSETQRHTIRIIGILDL